MNPVATRTVRDATAAVQFDAKSASQIARELFPGLEEPALQSKVNSVFIALVQRHLQISDTQIADYIDGRAAIERKFAPTAEVPEQAGVAAREQLSLCRADLELARANFYRALMSRKLVEAAEATLTAAESALTKAEEHLRQTNERIRQAHELLVAQKDELSRQIYRFEDRFGNVAAFVVWRATLHVKLVDDAERSLHGAIRIIGSRGTDFLAPK